MFCTRKWNEITGSCVQRGQGLLTLVCHFMVHLRHASTEKWFESNVITVEASFRTESLLMES